MVDAINQMRLALQADLQLRARVEAELADHRDRLEEIVGQRTAQLETAKEAADNALQQLQSAQRVLVESEKMASLGQLVAGVAHEINTPLGVAVTASSHLLELGLHVLQRQFDDGSLTREQLRDQLAQSAEAGEILVRNLERGAQLVQSFKQVSVDRSFDGHRSFDLREHLTQLVASLRPLWRQRPITVTIECPQDLVLDSLPGALGPVLTNPMQNALLYAFDERDGGRIEIHAHAASADDVEISVSDNGKGVDDSVRERMFEPFVTTRRQHGGTGLGRATSSATWWCTSGLWLAAASGQQRRQWLVGGGGRGRGGGGGGGPPPPPCPIPPPRSRARAPARARARSCARAVMLAAAIT